MGYQIATNECIRIAPLANYFSSIDVEAGIRIKKCEFEVIRPSDSRQIEFVIGVGKTMDSQDWLKVEQHGRVPSDC